MVTKRHDLTIVVPAFNEAEVILEFLNQVYSVVQYINAKVELIVIDDGSTDDTLICCKEFKKQLRSRSQREKIKFRVISIGRNAGHMNALITGMRLANSSYVLTMDADLQDPPELIPKLLTQIIESGVDVVQTVRRTRKSDSIFKRLSASFFYSLMKRLTGVDIIPHAADFRIMKKSAKDEIVNQAEYGNSVIRFMIPTLGLRTNFIYFDRVERRAGETKYPLREMLRLAASSIVTFSSVPLRMIAKIGFLLSMVFIGVSIVAAILKINGAFIPGWTSIIMLILTLHALTIFCIGTVSLYLSQIFDMQRRVKVVSREVNM
jgi:glycosyltransferase involved in cell wall biosynthesis